MIDTDIDPTHPEFLGDDDCTRVVVFKDFASGSPRAWSSADIDSIRTGNGKNTLRARALLGDQHQHGTRVASVIAGRHYGVAPGAQLILLQIPTESNVKPMNEALRFLQDTVAQLDKPYIINISLASDDGPRDGTTDDIERILGEMLTGITESQLKAIVVSAGNDHYDRSFTDSARNYPSVFSKARLAELENTRSHVRGVGTKTLQLELHTDPIYHDMVNISIWYPAGDLYDVKVTTPRGFSYGPVLAGHYLKDSSGERCSYADGGVGITNYQSPTTPGNIKITLRDYHSNRHLLSSSDGPWKVELIRRSAVGNGSWDAYIWGQSPTGLVKAFDTDSLGTEHNLYKINPWANNEQVLTVGSINDGTDVFRAEEFKIHKKFYSNLQQPNEPSHFSSLGPSRAGTKKPDIYACGLLVQVPTFATLDKVSDDIEYARSPDLESGTSFSSAVVSGLLALVLEYDSLNILKPRDIREMIVDSSIHQDLIGIDSKSGTVIRDPKVVSSQFSGLHKDTIRYISPSDTRKFLQKAQLFIQGKLPKKDTASRTIEGKNANDMKR